MDINYELYKVFYYVATSLSFSEASKQLFISQSAVSQSIKTLEKKLDQPLFIRSTKKVQLTPAGKVLLKHIEPAMNLIPVSYTHLDVYKRQVYIYRIADDLKCIKTDAKRHCNAKQWNFLPCQHIEILDKKIGIFAIDERKNFQ